MVEKIKESKWYKWEVLLLLWMGYLLNQGDRQVFNTVLPAVRDALSLTDTQAGLIATLFNFAFAIFVPVGGWLGDRFSCKWVTSLSVLLFSLATVFTGFATTLFWMIIFRSVATGGGEALFGPANYSLLAKYHTDTRAVAMSIHQTAYYVGVILAGVVAGFIADRLNWHYSFYFFGALGLIWGILMIVRLKDKPLEVVPTDERVAKPRFFDGFKAVFTSPTALTMTIGFSGLIFVITGYLTWVPAYLQEEFHQTTTASGFNSMFWPHAAAFVGILLAGSMSDRLARRDNKYRMYMQAAGLVLGSLFLFFMGGKSSLVSVYICFAGWGLARAFFEANTYPVLYDVTPEHLHASCGSVMGMTGFAVGALAPVILGAIKEKMGTLTAVFPVLAIVFLCCGVLMFVVAKRCYKRDHDRVYPMENNN